MSKTYSPETRELCEILERNGFGHLADEARELLPEDWEFKYDHTPTSLAPGVAYYLRYQEYTQLEVADEFGYVFNGPVSQGFITLRKYEGDP